MLLGKLKKLFRNERVPDLAQIRQVESALFAMDVTDIETRNDGLPRWDWDVVQRWCEQQGNSANEAVAWLAAERAWLWRLKEALGGKFILLESEKAFLLSSLPEKRAYAALDFIDRSQQRILQLLPGIARAPELGKEILVVLDDIDSYYSYISHFYPDDGEFAGSGGMYIGMGCGHFVTVKDELRTIEPVIVHELLHGSVSHLPLPTWLNEGLAVNVEHRLAGGRLSEYGPHELHQMHAEFWNSKTIQEFWSGDSFLRSDDGNLLSYDLGRILVEQFSADMESFTAFALSARSEDAGRAAAAIHLKMELGKSVCSLFELQHSADWEPDILQR